MNRKYTCAEYESIVNGLRENYPDAAITTDIMVGFPGETEDEFLKTAEFVRKISFADAHIFQYSQRKGTPAAKRPDQISPELKEKRSKVIADITQSSRTEFQKRFIGCELEVLFEQRYHKNDKYFEGKTGNYLTVVVPSGENLSGQFRTVELLEIKDDVIVGKLK